MVDASEFKKNPQFQVLGLPVSILLYVGHRCSTNSTDYLGLVTILPKSHNSVSFLPVSGIYNRDTY